MSDRNHHQHSRLSARRPGVRQPDRSFRRCEWVVSFSGKSIGLPPRSYGMAHTDSAVLVADRVWRLTIPLPFRPREVHAYVARLNGGGFLLVDGGLNTDTCWAALDAGVRSVAGDWSAVAIHVVTHMHMDHIGLAGRVREACGAHLAMSRLDAERAAHANAEPEEEAEYRDRLLRSHGAPEAVLAELQRSRGDAAALQAFVPPDGLLAGSQASLPAAPEWEYVRTSGHTAGHLSLFRARDGVLVAGDAVLPTISPTIGVNRQRQDPVEDYLAALAHLQRLPIRMLLPGHGEPLDSSDAVAARLTTLRETTEAETRRVRDLLAAPTTAWDLAAQRYTGRDLPTGPAVQALRETLAHLEHLTGWREIKREQEQDHIVRFGPF